MALIKCPECGKEISDTCDVCIHCGYKLQTKKKSSLKWKWDKKISIVIIAIIIIGIVASIIFFNKYQYKRDGFVGLDKKLTLEMQPDELDSLKKFMENWLLKITIVYIHTKTSSLFGKIYR